MFCCLVDLASSPNTRALEAVARACSPRVEMHGRHGVVFDVRGLERSVGTASVIAADVERMALAHGVTPRVVIAETMTSAWLLSHGKPPLQNLPIGVLAKMPALAPVYVGVCLTSFLRWGLHTLGDLARLSEADVRTRLGDVGARLHQAARGLDAAPLVPLDAPVRFYERLELEWPIEGLEPLSFVLSRLCESLSEALERADRGAVSVTTRLRLVTRATHERVLTLPAPMREARVLRSLILLDLESHSPGAAIDIVEVDLGVTPGLIVQGSLLTRALPSPEALTTLVARLRALMGESRVGAPVLHDTHDERVVRMKSFAPERAGEQASRQAGEERCNSPARPLARLPAALRRYRLPLAVSMQLDRGAPVRVRPVSRDVAGGPVAASAGPWRSSGCWWDAGKWDQDHWDIELPDGVYRVARDRTTGRWELEGAID